jgi:hypothetical protein
MPYAYGTVGVGETTVFLTDSRRAVLEGEYDGAENTKRTHKSRIRDRGRTALAELIEVAQSAEIDNADVFDPEQVGALLFWILNDPSYVDDLDGDTGGPITDLLPDDRAAYRGAVYVQAHQQLQQFDDPRPDDDRTATE